MNGSFIQVAADCCIGCRTCELACALSHEPLHPGSRLHPRLRVVKSASLSAPAVCHQCENAPCVAVCPEGALEPINGAIIPHSERCIGCKSCIVACPFGAIDIAIFTLNNGERASRIYKCDLCQLRPQGPACIASCPVDALSLMTPLRLRKLSAARRQRRGRV